MFCTPPSVPTPSSPSVKSYPSQLKPWPPLLKSYPPEILTALPKGVFLKIWQHSLSPPSTRQLAWDWLPCISLVSPISQRVPWEPRAHISCLSVSLNRIQQQDMHPYPPHLPLSPTPTCIFSPNRPLRVFLMCPAPCIRTFCSSAMNALPFPSPPVQILPFPQGLAWYSRNSNLPLRKTCI